MATGDSFLIPYYKLPTFCCIGKLFASAGLIFLNSSRATHVPVGHDQSQHLEYARDLAGSFNHKYGEIMVRPNTILGE